MPITPIKIKRVVINAFKLIDIDPKVIKLLLSAVDIILLVSNKRISILGNSDNTKLGIRKLENMFSFINLDILVI